MYYLYSPSWGAVTSVGYATYGFTDLRPPLPLPRAAPTPVHAHLGIKSSPVSAFGPPGTVYDYVATGSSL